MPNRLRFRGGHVQLRRLRVDSDTLLDAGDLVYLDSDDVKPASNFPWNTDLGTTQSDFAAVFLGVVQQPSTSGETGNVSVDVSPLSIYEFNVHSDLYEVGSLLGPDELNSALMSQQLEKTAGNASAIARSAEFSSANTNFLRMTFASAFHTGSANTNAQIG